MYIEKIEPTVISEPYFKIRNYSSLIFSKISSVKVFPP